MLIVSSLLLWAYPMFAQLHSIEIKVIDAENGNSIEFATVQWKGLNEPSYKNGTTTNRKGVATPIITAVGVPSSLVAFE
ncbi:hypothetical protein HQ45_03380 [Porphyromonas crevioricanis]|nr:hypothetical protein HQ45_03380 [Porphyromonas crevioricanis]